MSTQTVGAAKQEADRLENVLNDDGLRSKIEEQFKLLDADKSGKLNAAEARVLIHQLCAVMRLDATAEGTVSAHMKLLDRDGDGELCLGEAGSAIVGALMHRFNTIKHYLAFAERDKLGDDAPLPTQ